jgi:hypothetical protein
MSPHLFTYEPQTLQIVVFPDQTICFLLYFVHLQNLI